MPYAKAATTNPDAHRRRSRVVWAGGFVAFLMCCTEIGAQVPKDQISIQRVLVSPSKLPAELERVRSGAMVQMPREEFEALVDQATRKRESSARLVSAVYSAELSGLSLHGKGTWNIRAAQPGVLPLPD